MYIEMVAVATPHFVPEGISSSMRDFIVLVQSRSNIFIILIENFYYFVRLCLVNAVVDV